MKNTTTTTELYEYADGYNYSSYYPYDKDDAAPCSLRDTWTFVSNFAPLAYILVFILALVGNILVLCVIRRYRQSRHNLCSFSLTDTFLLHLAISDLLLAMTLPFFAVQWINEWIFGLFACKIAGVLFSLNVYCGVLFLACISFDRYLAIVHAVNISWRRKSCHAQLACAVIWIVCLGLTVVDMHYRDVVLLYGRNQQVCQVVFSQESSQQWQIGMQLVSLFLGFVFPLLVMLYCYICIFKALCHTSTRRQKRRSLRLIVSLVVVFVVSWAPYNALRMTDSLKKLGVIVNSCGLNNVLDMGILVTESMGLAHCALNPLLYGLVGIKFRRELAQMCKAVLGLQGCLGLAGWAQSRGSTRRPTGSFSSVDSENTSSVMA
ncbi:C-X-C chemokine receptor type 3-2-like isoform X2 [Myxocyprinus asiaticus]|uniref:C-X-C chemokine receptor type 3-2-like isoform X2 n=1 Tax=Myxocyprinus asiaticus TaxID=70543 RepID=UPI002221AF26|nr:C-X-C chemokine receptor type 3-2-like isoform X2 [Myxocyprinus asiaticus]XP_051575486.1 C-X-C chemokine receptor type 3-2-like isoform X2 [Myxocyprinus asiaticus]